MLEVVWSAILSYGHALMLMNCLVNSCGQVIVLCLLLISGSIVYFKKRQTATMSGFSRIQSNARF